MSTRCLREADAARAIGEQGCVTQTPPRGSRTGVRVKEREGNGRSGSQYRTGTGPVTGCRPPFQRALAAVVSRIDRTAPESARGPPPSTLGARGRVALELPLEASGDITNIMYC